MKNFGIGKRSGVLAAAAVAALGMMLYGSQAVSRGGPMSDPTAVGSYDRAAVGGRTGCEVQTWPDVAPECLVGATETAKSPRRI